MVTVLPTNTSMNAPRLQKKILNRTAKVGVIGLGYVGLPLAVSIAKSDCDVIGFDVDQKKVNMINKANNYISDVADEDLESLVASKAIVSTTNFNQIKNMDIVIICVPTPIDKHKQPNLEFVKNAVNSISQYIEKGTLVILESTTYPGTTDEIIKPILQFTGLICGRDFYLAYSPERVDPGNKKFKTSNTPKVVGGVTTGCTEIASIFYRNILGIEIHKVSSPNVAEMEKLLENTFRNVNIALVNEMAILCEKMGIDIWEVIDAAATKPYGFMPFYPGPGIGGHCIPIDPWYLSWKAKEFSFNTRLIEVADDINQGMPEFVVNRSMKILNQYEKTLNKANVLVLGLAYKKDTSDYRESPVLSILEKLTDLGANWKVVDPHIERFSMNGIYKLEKGISSGIVDKADLVIITTDHSCFDYKLVLNSGKPVFDTRNINKENKYQIGDNYFKL